MILANLLDSPCLKVNLANESHLQDSSPFHGMILANCLLQQQHSKRYQNSLLHSFLANPVCHHASMCSLLAFLREISTFQQWSSSEIASASVMVLRRRMSPNRPEIAGRTQPVCQRVVPNFSGREKRENRAFAARSGRATKLQLCRRWFCAYAWHRAETRPMALKSKGESIQYANWLSLTFQGGRSARTVYG